MRKRRRILRLILILALAYLGIGFAMWLLENRLVFPAQTAADAWENPPSAEFEEVFFPSEGNRIHGWFLPSKDSGEVILLCHGNGGNLSYRGETLLRLRERLGRSVFIFDYPGYGKSTGKPSEPGCYASGNAALNWLAENKGVPAERTILFGESLGGGIAVELAGSRPCRALVLVKTFTSLPDVVRKKFWFLPVNWLMRNRFNNLGKIAKVQAPVFIVGATADEIVPYALSRQLFEAAREPKKFMALEGHGHNDKLPDEFLDAVRLFLDAN